MSYPNAYNVIWNIVFSLFFIENEQNASCSDNGQQQQSMKLQRDQPRAYINL